mmetsp:Transcript_49009/g.78299  ORF Transcript_49009/g.78299 Transcript_49009/m.78299 type:complete len:86 (+) Transcript_49009:139-396(+)
MGSNFTWKHNEGGTRKIRRSLYFWMMCRWVCGSYFYFSCSAEAAGKATPKYGRRRRMRRSRSKHGHKMRMYPYTTDDGGRRRLMV